MEKFSVDADKCKGCGLCEKECGWNRVITVHDGSASYNNSKNCIECLHCFKVCPNCAINYHGRGAVRAKIYGPGEQMSALLTRRSCREYKSEPLNRDLLTAVINEANSAPRFDIRFDERKFIVLNDAEKLESVRIIVLGEIDKTRKLFGMLAKNPFLPKAQKTEYCGIVDLFENILKKNEKKDSLFHGASTLVMVAGQKKKSTAKDNSLYAMSQFLVAAEEKEIGTCINGFVSFFSKPVQRFLGIANAYSIHCAAVAGYPSRLFHRHLVRSDASISWH